MQVELSLPISMSHHPFTDPCCSVAPLVMHHLKKPVMRLPKLTATHVITCWLMSVLVPWMSHSHRDTCKCTDPLLHSCYETTSPCGPPTQRGRGRTGGTLGSRRRCTTISLTSRRGPPTTRLPRWLTTWSSSDSKTCFASGVLPWGPVRDL